jgi:hypothetical protein
MSQGLKLDIRFRQATEQSKGVDQDAGYVTIVLQGKQTVQRFVPAWQGLAFLEGYASMMRKMAQDQEIKKIAVDGLKAEEKGGSYGVA